MAYAVLADMVGRFGETEMIRLSAPDGVLANPPVIVAARVTRALDDASTLIDSYLRKRMAVPVSPVAPELVRAACVLARFDLAHGEQREPTEQMRKAREDVIDWLKLIAKGDVALPGPGGAPGAAPASRARTADRPRDFSAETLRDW